MPDYSLLPAVNAVLNGASAVLLYRGRTLIKRGRIATHRRFMLAAVVSSNLFLISYLWYHAHAGVVRFQGQDWPRPVYFSILITHTILAVSLLPLVLITLTRGLRGRYARHRPIARWTYPIWLYVSVTGVVIYVMLYHLYRS